MCILLLCRLNRDLTTCGNVCLFRSVMIQLAESILEEDTTLGIAYLLALHEVCNGLSCRDVIKTSYFQFSKGSIFQQNVIKPVLSGHP